MLLLRERAVGPGLEEDTAYILAQKATSLDSLKGREIWILKIVGDWVLFGQDRV